MNDLYRKIKLAANHLIKINAVFAKKANYTNEEDFIIYKENFKILRRLLQTKEIKRATLKIYNTNRKKKQIGISFVDEIYHQYDRQMKLADFIEYLFLSRGIYFLFQGNQFKKDRVKIFLEVILRFVNLLMIYEAITVDKKLRNKVLNKLKLVKEHGFNELKKWKSKVGHPKQSKNAPAEYFDTLLPKTAGGLWHELLVYAFLLKYNVGYIFPLLLTQKPIALSGKLSPPDLIVLHHKTFRYYGIEIGSLKERQSGGFMVPSGIPIIPIDTLNARISDRCPICSRWIGICPKVITEFIENRNPLDEPINEIRCLTDCELFTLKEKVEGKCLYMKFSSNSFRKNKYSFTNGNHYHYHCCVNKNKGIIKDIRNEKKFEQLENFSKLNDDEKNQLKKKFNYLKTHSIYYGELKNLILMNKEEIELEP